MSTDIEKKGTDICRDSPIRSWNCLPPVPGRGFSPYGLSKKTGTKLLHRCRPGP